MSVSPTICRNSMHRLGHHNNLVAIARDRLGLTIKPNAIHDLANLPRSTWEQVPAAFALTVLQAGMRLTRCAVTFLPGTRPTRGWSRALTSMVAAVTPDRRTFDNSVPVAGLRSDQPVTVAGFLVAWTMNPAALWCVVACDSDTPSPWNFGVVNRATLDGDRTHPQHGTAGTGTAARQLASRLVTPASGTR
ncbi:hypothetical protein ACQPXH_20110 [Nocardia sp. CA-135953]|uniref:hypothetical protein n=1 Tax=Nocardia sp. CA-135953 TaxID=3239978 RepID=UPI003D983DE9